MNKHLFALIASIALATSAFAQTVVTQPWARATVPQQTSGGIYLQLRSPDAARLVKASSPAARSVEIHTMEMSGQMMKMRGVDAVDLPAGQTVGNFHIMLMGLKQQLKEGQTVPLSLTIERKDGKRETIAVDAPVKPIGFTPSHH
jgi:copper(I)-binding protein